MATREEVQAALAPRPRVCPSCGRTQAGTGRACGCCGADLVARRTRRRPSRRLLALAAAGLALAGGVAVATVPGMRASAERERRAAAAAQGRLEAAERARLTAEMRPLVVAGPALRRGESRLAHRKRLVAAGEVAITSDARRRAAAGRISGTITGTACSPFPRTDTRRALEADPYVEGGRYQCLAYSRRFELPELEGRRRTGMIGVPYYLVADYGSGRLTFCKVSPRPGEGGRALATVVVPPPCRDPLRRSAPRPRA